MRIEGVDHIVEHIFDLLIDRQNLVKDYYLLNTPGGTVALAMELLHVAGDGLLVIRV